MTDRSTTTLLAAVCLAAALAPPLHADWRQFRGNNSDGHGTGLPPVDFGPTKNCRWTTPLAPGHSSPCISGQHIFVTTCDSESLTLGVVCLSRDNGDVLWERSLPVESLEKGHPSFNAASSSPCCDGERVVAYFGSYGLICFDTDGNLLWETRLPLTKSYAGNATSPMIAGDKVILYRGNYVDHYLLCLNKHTGEELWRVPQSETFTGEMACTACPLIAGDALICYSARSVQAFDLESGDQRWIAMYATTTTSTPILVEDEVIVAAWNKLGEPDLRPPFPGFGELLQQHDNNSDGFIARNEFPRLWIFHRPEGAEAPQNGAPVSFRQADRNGNGKIENDEWIHTTKELEEFRAGYNTHGLLAIPLNSSGPVGADDVRTLTTQGIPEVPSPVSDGQNVYVVKNGGLLTCVEVASGRTIYRIRTRGTGTHYASPLIAGGRLYTFSGNGRVSVIELGEDPDIVAINEMDDGVYATPAIVDGVIYLRTHSALHAFEETDNR